MSTPGKPPSSEEIKSDLNRIGQNLFNFDDPLLAEQPATAEQVYLQRLNEQLKNYREGYLQRSRLLYQKLENSDLHSEEGKKLLATLKIRLNTQLINLDLSERIDGKPAKTFLIYDAGFTAFDHLAHQAVKDRLLHPQAGALLEKLALGPILRPALYALQFSYQENTVELAGAFVVTEKNSPQVSDLLTDQSVGYAVLFTPARGLEFFDSLADLDAHLLKCVTHATGKDEFMQMLPADYHGVGVAGIWPLQMTLIDGAPLFEHTYDALIDKRTQDIERALSFTGNPQHDAAKLYAALDRAVGGALPDFTSCLDLHAQTLFERNLYYSAPDWYRSASATRQTELAQHLQHYNQARYDLLQLMGAVVSPPALARYQWLERLSDDLEIEDLDPDHLQIKTRRYLAGYGIYKHLRSLTDLALLGPHAGDESEGSDFLLRTTLTYKNAALPADYADVTPAWLIQQALTLQPRIDFANAQKQLHAQPAVSQAIEHMFDQRIVALAYTAWLQGHLLDTDWQLIQDLRAGDTPHLQAAFVSLNDAKLQDLWVLRQSDDCGALKRVLLCTPQAPRDQQFVAFASEQACQTHILGWASHDAAAGMKAYLIERAPLRFRQNLEKILAALGFQPEAMEHKEVRFVDIGNHRNCLAAMARHMLATRIDDYDFSTPLWYRSASASNRKKLTTLTEQAEGALRAFDAHHWSGSRFQRFDAFVHEKAKISLNRLLERPANDVDPDTVWVHAPTSVVPSLTPAPLNYTKLFRDGYPDNFGLLDQKISQSARFTGPPGIDLKALTPQKVARSVTGVWIGRRYTDKVKAELQSPASVGYGFRRNATLAITQRQMKRAALECQLQGHIASADLQWLEQSIDNMGDTTAVTRTRYALHRLMIDGEWVIDAWLFSHGENPVLLYTPDAPDGISFREARLFNYCLKQQVSLSEYLTARVGVQARNRVRAFLHSARKALPATLDRTTPSPARYDSTRLISPVDDLRYALYDLKLQRKIDDIHATTVGRTEMITDLIWNCVEWFVAIATAPFPFLSLTGGLLLAFKDAMLALHAYRQGDTAMALQHLLGYLLNSAGGLLTDLRPALRSIKKFIRLPRLKAFTAAPEQAMKLIEPLQQVSTVPRDMRPVVYRGQTLWAGKSPDSLGRFLLHRLDTQTDTLRSTGILASPNADGIMVRSGVAGGAPKYEAVADTPGPHKDYGMAAKYRDNMEMAINPQSVEKITKHSEDYAYTNPKAILDVSIMKLDPTRKAYVQQVEKLATAAKQHWDTFTPLPARTPLPAVAADTSFAQLLASDALTGKNLVIGARPGSIASKQALIAHIDTLVDSGFKHLYLQYLPGDVFHLKLEKLNKGKSWKHIKNHLKAVDAAFGYGRDAPFSYVALVREAQKKGLKIKALDASTSYHLEDVLRLSDVSPLTPRGNNIRNFYSHKVIAADIADAPDERWIVLADDSRMVTHANTPGLADLHDAVAVRIEDVALDQPASIKLDAPGAIIGDATAKGDYHMTLPTGYKAPEAAAPVASAASGSRATHFNEFDIKQEHHAHILKLGDEPKGLHPSYEPGLSEVEKRQAYFAFHVARKNLTDKATSHFADYIPPAKATPPTLAADAKPDALFKQVADSDLPGVVLGEAHSAQSSKTLLIEQLAQQKGRYKTLYVEHLCTDLHQADLDAFRKNPMSESLAKYLRSQDANQMERFAKAGEIIKDNYTAVIQAAAKHGYRIRALDCLASYKAEGLDDLIRNRMFSYFASRVIEADQLKHGPHKWIAFVGSAHTDYNLGVPGLADMLGAVSLHVRETTPALARGLHRGYWETVTDGIPSTTRTIRSDFKLEVGIAQHRTPSSPAPAGRNRLAAIGDFVIERPSSTETRLVHWSKKEGIVTTPIQVDEKGLFFIDRWDRALDRFKTLEQLIMMLQSEVHLRHVT